jgi:hypothetical protein
VWKVIAAANDDSRGEGSGDCAKDIAPQQKIYISSDWGF